MLWGGWIWERALRFSDTLRTAWRKSAVCCALAKQPLTLPRQVQTRGFVKRMMHAREESAILAFLQRRGRMLLQTATGSLGLYLLFCGVLFGVCAVARHGSNFSALFCALALIVAAFPLLGSMKPVALSLVGSALLSHFLQDWCGFLINGAYFEKKGRLRPLQSLLSAALTVLPSVWIAPQTVCIVLLCLLLLALLFAVPELHAVAILLLFPWLRLLEHPTVILGEMCLSFFVSYLLKVAFGRRVPSFSYTDAAALLLALQFLLSFVGGSGAVSDAAVAAVMTLAWIPMRQTLALFRWQKRCVRVAALSCTVVSLIGVFQYAFGFSELKWIDADRFLNVGGRVTSVFDNPNVLAVYLLLHFPVLLCAALDGERRKGARCAYLFGAAACTLCLVLTWTRGAWLGWIAELFLILLSYSRTSLAAGMTFLPFAVAALPLLPQSVKQRFVSIGSVADSSSRYRIYTWQGVCRMIGANPCGIGVGERAFVTLYPRYAVSGTERVMHAHQIFLQILLELGWCGLLTFLIFLLLVLLCAVQKGVQNGGAVALVGTLVMGLFDHLWYYRGMLVLFLTACALCTVGGEESLWKKDRAFLSGSHYWIGSF